MDCTLLCACSKLPNPKERIKYSLGFQELKKYNLHNNPTKQPEEKHEESVLNLWVLAFSFLYIACNPKTDAYHLNYPFSIENVEINVIDTLGLVREE